MLYLQSQNPEAILDSAALVFKALGDPTRLRILAVLRHGELCVCDIMAVLGLPQSTASRHLAYLRNAGWLTARRQNKWMYYRLSTDALDQGIVAAVTGYMTALEPLQNDYEAMSRHLAEKSVAQRCGQSPAD